LEQLPPKRQTTDYYAWYARGYRYPVACSVVHTLNDDAQPVTAIRKTYCLPPSIQAGIADPINEEIRQADQQQRDSLSRKPVSDIMHYSLKKNGSRLAVDYTLGQSASITFIVADAMGIVYRQQHAAGNADEPSSVTIDCSGLRHGQYILYINANGCIQYEKFVI